MIPIHDLIRKKGTLFSSRTRLILTAVFLLLCHVGIAFLSLDFIYGQGHSRRPILLYVALYSSAFVLYVSAVWQAAKRASFRTASILAIALLLRLIFLFSNPIQEDDFYRYLWDGKVVASGLNPYRFAPAAVEKGEEGTQHYQAILASDSAFVEILARVNHPWVLTIYPPLAQGIFGAAALFAPGSLTGLRIIFLLFDLSLCGLLVYFLRHLGLNETLVLVYAWSPLVVKETINSTHYDVVPTFFFVLALWALFQQWRKFAFVSLALAILGKLYPALFVPLFLRRVKESAGWASACEGAVILIVVLLAGYVPFLDAGTGLWQGAAIYAEQWQTNSFLFPLLVKLVENRWLANGMVSVVLGSLIFLLPRWYDLSDDSSFLWMSFVVLGALFLFSPVGDPWYFVWLAPFLCFFLLRSWILLSGLLGLYYVSFYFSYHEMKETFRWVEWLEYMPFYSLLIQEWFSARSTRESASSQKSGLCVFL